MELEMGRGDGFVARRKLTQVSIWATRSSRKLKLTLTQVEVVELNSRQFRSRQFQSSRKLTQVELAHSDLQQKD